MKIVSRDCQKRLLVILIFQFVFASFVVFNIKVEDVSAAAPVSPYIKIVPEQTINSSLTVGSNYTVSIVTDYSGSDIWAWQFSLTFDPYVLHGGINTTDTWTQTSSTRKTWYATKPPIVANTEKIYQNETLKTKNVDYTIDYGTGKITFMAIPPKGTVIKAIYIGYSVVNGDLINTAKHYTATFVPGTIGFNNTDGTLRLVGAFFDYVGLFPPPTTSGPGTLANVTFMVVGTGISNITLGSDTNLVVYDAPTNPPQFSNIIDAGTMPDHIGHGYFDNLPNVHDVAVSRLVAPSTAIPGDVVAINVTARNEGNFTENFDVTVHANTTLIGTQTTNLARGAKATLTFNWNTTDVLAGSYIINATAWLSGDVDPSDNVKTWQTEIKSVHDVAVVSLEIPSRILIGTLARINMTVRNEGNIEENVNLTTSYEELVATNPPPVVINATNFILAERPTSKIISVIWNTTGLAAGDYKINATATINVDEDSSDNTQTRQTSLSLPFHDIVVVDISANSTVFVGEQVTINATVRNDGSFNESLVEVKITYDSTAVGSQSISILVGENKTLSFTWDTTGMTVGTYSVSAEAILSGDATPANNLKVAAVVVNASPPPPPGHIAGTVTDSSTGNPIEGASVAANGYSDTTDVNGHFNITNVPVGTYQVTASANGYQTSSKTGISVTAGSTTNLNFALVKVPAVPTHGHIAGTVIDSSTGDPIEGATVTANGNSTSTDVNGSYNIELQLGTYTVTASAQGYEDSSQTNIAVNAGATTTLNFKLTPVAHQTNIIPLILVGTVVVVVIIAGIAVYFLKVKK